MILSYDSVRIFIWVFCLGFLLGTLDGDFLRLFDILILGRGKDGYR